MSVDRGTSITAVYVYIHATQPLNATLERLGSAPRQLKNISFPRHMLFEAPPLCDSASAPPESGWCTRAAPVPGRAKATRSRRRVVTAHTHESGAPTRTASTEHGTRVVGIPTPYSLIDQASHWGRRLSSDHRLGRRERGWAGGGGKSVWVGGVQVARPWPRWLYFFSPPSSFFSLTSS